MIDHGARCNAQPCTCGAAARVRRQRLEAEPWERRYLSPDCRDGNHQKCDGMAWDMVRDDYCNCGCDCRDD